MSVEREKEERKSMITMVSTCPLNQNNGQLCIHGSRLDQKREERAKVSVNNGQKMPGTIQNYLDTTPAVLQ